MLEPEFDSDGAGGYAAIFALTLPDGFSLTRAAREAEALADRLRRVPGTSLVDLHGLPEEEVLVTLDPARAAALGLTADEVSAAIRAADAKVQAGRLRGERDRPGSGPDRRDHLARPPARRGPARGCGWAA